MNKKEFVDYLNDKLFYLVENEKNKVIEKYVSVIDNYVNMGQTEEQAIAAFGNIDDIVIATYLSHGLDYKKIADNKVSAKGLKGAVKNFFNIITGHDKKSARSAIFYLIYIILIAILVKVLFIIVRDQGSTIFSDLISSSVANKAYYAFFEVIYIIVAFILFIKMFTKRFK